MTVTVQTARGPVPVSALGRVLMHEHIFVLSPEVQQNWQHCFKITAVPTFARPCLRSSHRKVQG